MSGFNFFPPLPILKKFSTFAIINIKLNTMRKLLMLSVIAFIAFGCSKDDIKNNYDELSFEKGEQACWTISKQMNYFQEDSAMLVFSKSNKSVLYLYWEDYKESSGFKDFSESHKGEIVSYNFPNIVLRLKLDGETEKIINATLNSDKTEMIIKGKIGNLENPTLKKQVSLYHSLD